MNDHPVRVGSMLYTLVDPHRGHERAYNRWYERDHFYAGCMAGPWFFAGRRWVATRELKDLRFPVDSPVAAPVDKGSFLATYWVLEGKHDECWAWANDQVWHLYQQGRGFAKRDHAHSVLFDSPWSHYRDADPVPVELAFDHNYAGLVSVFVDCNESTTDDEFRAFLTAGPLAALMTPDSPVASCSAWTPLPRDPASTATPRWSSAPRPVVKVDRCSSSSSTTTPARAGTSFVATPRRSTRQAWRAWCSPHRSSRPSSGPTPTPTSSGSRRSPHSPTGRPVGSVADPLDALGDGRTRVRSRVDSRLPAVRERSLLSIAQQPARKRRKTCRACVKSPETGVGERCVERGSA